MPLPDADSPFLIGIDLGTTNCACAFVDTRQVNARVELFQIPQLTHPFNVAPHPVLPSFLYFGDAHEIENGSLALPWNATPDAVVGVFARERGATAPARQVASAKSWLAHPGVDRQAAILPFGAAGGPSGADTSPRISPVDASARCLAHIRDAWNATLAATDAALRLERQKIVLTVPASFDEEARELTVESAQRAELSRLTLLEEPIAAFYAWMAEHDDAGVADLLDEHVALVCDVGGGTTDFSLIRVRIDPEGPAFERIAIGDHLLLGGDNVDVALAAIVERRMLERRPSLRLAITQRSTLRRLSSAAKERMLGPSAPSRVAVTILGTGRALVGDALTADLTLEDVERTLGDFLPIAASGEFASPRDRRAGLRELGLPYETDPAITRHLASFLARSAPALPDDHRAVTTIGGRNMIRPDLVLFNGGFFTPQMTRDRVAMAMRAWFGESPRLLRTNQLEAAVALGAVTYAQLRVRHDAGVARAPLERRADRVGRHIRMVKAGSGRAYFVGLRTDNADQTIAAVCVLARGTEEGTLTHIAHPFTIEANRPISFPLYSSTLRSDSAGDLVSLRSDEDIREHAPLVTVLRYGRKSRQVELPVRLSAAFTEVGTLELWCESQVSDHRWRVQFQLREQSGVDEPLPAPSILPRSGAVDPADAAEAIVADEQIEEGARAIRLLFQDALADVTSDQLVAHLERVLGYGKTAWPLAVIRRFADSLIETADGRRRSAPLEARWLNLFGFCLRPGFGAIKDPWRIAESRKIYAAGLTFAGSIQNRVEWLVLWQRAAGGFSAGQQRELAQRVMGELGLSGKKAVRFNPQMERESWRLLGSLERLEAPLRVGIGDELLRRIRRDPDNASFLWAIGRLGARVPLYGPLSSVVPPDHASRWIDALLAIKGTTPDLAAAIVQIGARTGDSLRDVDLALASRARQRLSDANIDDIWARPLHEVVTTSSAADANRVFGEPLPRGLRLDMRETQETA